MPKKSSVNEFIEKSKAIFGDQLDYSKVQYINVGTKVELICKKHKHSFFISPNAHISCKRGCLICSGLRINTTIFIEKAIAINEDKFIYDEVNFVNMTSDIIIKCITHGPFLQTPHKHLDRKQGCPQCKKSAHKNQEYVIKEATKIHKGFYDYSLVKFTRMFDKIIIICPKHGEFKQTPTNHINHEHGCPKCATEATRLLLSDFIQRSLIIHPNKYDYSKSIYVNSLTKIEIICPTHGSFWQKPNAHLSGNGCSWCTGQNSQGEDSWLNYLNIPLEFRNKILRHGKKHYRVDAYDPNINTIYEFYGDYWHGNPKIYKPEYTNKHNKILFSTLYENTMKRKEKLIALGYKIIFIWENEFNATK